MPYGVNTPVLPLRAASARASTCVIVRPASGPDTTFFVLKPGFQATFTNARGRLVVTVLNDTENVGGAHTRVVEEREWKGTELVEVSRNFFAMDPKTGDVYYFGEYVDTYRHGKVANHEGSWRHGRDGATFGLMMPGRPAAGMKFYQNDNDAKADLLSGKIAGFIDGPWQSGDLSKALGDKLAVAEGPKGTGEWGPMTAPDGFYINASSPNVDLAKGFALQFLQPANEQIFADAGHLPANTTLQPKDPIAQSFSALMPKGFARPTAVDSRR